MDEGNETWLEGGCHCRALRFRVRVDPNDKLVECNCSICRMKGIVHLIVDGSDFVFEGEVEALSTYQFNTKVARHHFCRTCGIHAFYVPRSHPDGIDVNANCLDDRAWVASRKIVRFDGANWEASVDSLRTDLGEADG